MRSVPARQASVGVAASNRADHRRRVPHHFEALLAARPRAGWADPGVAAIFGGFELPQAPRPGVVGVVGDDGTMAHVVRDRRGRGSAAQPFASARRSRLRAAWRGLGGPDRATALHGSIRWPHGPRRHDHDSDSSRIYYIEAFYTSLGNNPSKSTHNADATTRPFKSTYHHVPSSEVSSEEPRHRHPDASGCRSTSTAGH